MSLIGIGLYTFEEAATLTGIPSRDLKRWLDGYSYRSGSTKERVTSAPLWETELSEDDISGISFHDLLEVRFVAAFRKHGVSLQTIRYASRNARNLFNHPYPFTCQRFRTDGRSIFLEALEESGEVHLFDLAKKQYAFSQVIEPSLYRGIEFDEQDLASRWYPLGRNKGVVLDPKRAFGKPIVAQSGIRTSTLYDAFKVEGSTHAVARLYEIPVSEVDVAISYEERLAA